MGTLKRISGPAYIAAAAADLYAPPAATIYTVIRQIRVTNKSGSAATFAIYVGATNGSAGGTEIAGPGKSVAAGDSENIFFSPGLRMSSTDFLSAVASGASTLVAVVMGDQHVV